MQGHRINCPAEGQHRESKGKSEWTQLPSQNMSAHDAHVNIHMQKFSMYSQPQLPGLITASLGHTQAAAPESPKPVDTATKIWKLLQAEESSMQMVQKSCCLKDNEVWTGQIAGKTGQLTPSGRVFLLVCAMRLRVWRSLFCLYLPGFKCPDLHTKRTGEHQLWA